MTLKSAGECNNYSEVEHKYYQQPNLVRAVSTLEYQIDALERRFSFVRSTETFLVVNSRSTQVYVDSAQMQAMSAQADSTALNSAQPQRKHTQAQRKHAQPQRKHTQPQRNHAQCLRYCTLGLRNRSSACDCGICHCDLLMQVHLQVSTMVIG